MKTTDPKSNTWEEQDTDTKEDTPTSMIDKQISSNSTSELQVKDQVETKTMVKSKPKSRN